MLPFQKLQMIVIVTENKHSQMVLAHEPLRKKKVPLLSGQFYRQRKAYFNN